MISWFRRLGARWRAIIGIAVVGLRHDRTRTLLAVMGIALAVLATTALGGTGYGVMATGEEKFSSSGRDLWITGGPLQFAPGSVGGIENSITDAHEIAAAVKTRESVQTAVPLSFQTVYVGSNRSDFETIIGVGGPARGGSVQITEGREFQHRDIHYANGTYEGPMTHEVVIDSQTAAMFNVSVNDTLYIGGTIADARRHNFTVVGISPTYSRFLGSPTVILHLSELQEVTGETGTDSASLITVALNDGADATRVEEELQAEYPAYDVRTNREQLEATLKRQAVVLASGTSLVGLAIVAGIALTVNLLLGLVYQQRRELAALKALGGSTRTLAGIAGIQAIILGIVGGLVGVGATVPTVTGLNLIAAEVVGFEDVVRMPRELLVGGFVIALVMSIVGAVVAGWRVARLSPIEQLRE